MSNSVCNSVSNGVRRSSRPDPTRPDPYLSTYVCLWSLAIETLIVIIISQRAREMMMIKKGIRA